MRARYRSPPSLWRNMVPALPLASLRDASEHQVVKNKTKNKLKFERGKSHFFSVFLLTFISADEYAIFRQTLSFRISQSTCFLTIWLSKISKTLTKLLRPVVSCMIHLDHLPSNCLLLEAELLPKRKFKKKERQDQTCLRHWLMSR